MAIQGFISGGLTTQPGANQVLAVYCVCVPGVIRNVVAACIPGTAGGASATIMDVQKNGASVWTDPTHRPTLPAGTGGQQQVFTTYKPNNGSLRRGDVITLICIQAGGKSNVAMTAAVEDP
jgi:hypothetical protein